MVVGSREPLDLRFKERPARRDGPDLNEMPSGPMPALLSGGAVPAAIGQHATARRPTPRPFTGSWHAIVRRGRPRDAR